MLHYKKDDDDEEDANKIENYYNLFQTLLSILYLYLIQTK